MNVRAEILDALVGVAPDVDPESLGDGDDLRDDLDLDSMDFLNLLVAVHERLGVEVPEADYTRVRTLGQLVEYVSARRGEERKAGA